MSNGYIDKAEVEAILSGGQPAVNKFVVETVIQLKHGQEKQHNLLEDHIIEADVRDKDISAVKLWQTDWEKTCPSKLKAAVHAEIAPLLGEHAKNHPPAPPRRKNDKSGEDFSGDRRVWLMWEIGSKVSYFLMAVLITVANIAVHYLLMGEP